MDLMDDDDFEEIIRISNDEELAQLEIFMWRMVFFVKAYKQHLKELKRQEIIRGYEDIEKRCLARKQTPKVAALLERVIEAKERFLALC